MKQISIEDLIQKSSILLEKRLNTSSKDINIRDASHDKIIKKKTRLRNFRNNNKTFQFINCHAIVFMLTF